MGDRTVSIPTPVSNEEAEQVQREWDAYDEALKQQRETAIRATGGGCVSTALAIAAMVAGLLAGVM